MHCNVRWAFGGPRNIMLQYHIIEYMGSILGLMMRPKMLQRKLIPHFTYNLTPLVLERALA